MLQTRRITICAKGMPGRFLSGWFHPPIALSTFPAGQRRPKNDRTARTTTTSPTIYIRLFMGASFPVGGKLFLYGAAWVLYRRVTITGNAMPFCTPARTNPGKKTCRYRGSSRAMRTISPAISSGERIRSMQPLAMALSGMSACLAVSGFWAIVIPPMSLMPHSASAPSPS